MRQAYIYKLAGVPLLTIYLLLFFNTGANASFLVKKQAVDEHVVSGKTPEIAVLSEKFLAFKKQKVSLLKNLTHLTYAPEGGKKGLAKRRSMATLSVVFGVLGYISLAGAILIGISAYVWPPLTICIVLATLSVFLAFGATILGSIARNRNDPKAVRRPALTGKILGFTLLGVLAFVGLIILALG